MLLQTLKLGAVIHDFEVIDNVEIKPQDGENNSYYWGYTSATNTTFHLRESLLRVPSPSERLSRGPLRPHSAVVSICWVSPPLRHEVLHLLLSQPVWTLTSLWALPWLPQWATCLEELMCRTHHLHHSSAQLPCCSPEVNIGPTTWLPTTKHSLRP